MLSRRTRSRWIVLSMVALALAGPAHAADQGAPVGPLLQRLAADWEQGERDHVRAVADALGIRLVQTGPEVLVPVILEPWDGDAASIDPVWVWGAGAELDATSRSYVRALAPFERVGDLAQHPDVARVRLPTPHVSTLGAVESEAVQLTGADVLHGAGIDGSGVRVAVIDRGFQELTSAIGAGELPSGTQAVIGGTEVNWSDVENTSNHGSAVAEQVLDMAPGADLYAIQVADDVDLQNAADYCDSEGIAVVAHAMGWGLASYYDDSGPITGIVNDSRDQDDVLWAVSSGNMAECHWRGTWADADNDDRLDWATGDDVMSTTGGTGGGMATIFVQWDQYGNAGVDLSLEVRNSSNNVVATSDFDQDGDWDPPPMEVVNFTYSNAAAPYRIIVRDEGDDAPGPNLDISLFSFDNPFEHQVPGSSLIEPADAHGSMTVGAINRLDWSDPSPAIQDFSSRGPTNDGRVKPDIVAPDNTSSWVYGAAAWGTSFASPVVAGAAALLLDQDPTMTADEVYAALTGAANDVGDPGWDDVFGAGQLRLDAGVCIDVDGDGYGNGAFGNQGCTQVAVDCDDDDDEIYPGADEICDGADNDCDGATDETDAVDATDWYRDLDGDGFGDDISLIHGCYAPLGYVALGGDCDDSDPAVFPGAQEVPDGIDNDCDGLVDEGSVAVGAVVITEVMLNPDAVGDLVGEFVEVVNVTGTPIDLQGWVLRDDDTDSHVIAAAVPVAAGGRVLLCRDGDSSVNGGMACDYDYEDVNLQHAYDDEIVLELGGTEIDAVRFTPSWPHGTGVAMQLDPGAIDDVANDDPASWCAASAPYGSGDLGTPGAPNDSCGVPSPDNDNDGWTIADGDCDDGDASVHPGANDICNGIDDDCDGQADEGFDQDGDGVTTCGGDCHDGNASVYPGAPELQDGVDNDCDGLVDETAVPVGAVVITEILLNPDAVGDGEGEFVEVVNVSGSPVDLQGWVLRDDDTDAHTIASSVAIAAGGTALLCRNGDAGVNGGMTCDYDYGYAYNIQHAYADEVVLELDGIEIDGVRFDPSWPHGTGVAMQLDPQAVDHLDNDDAANWCEATSPYGAGDLGTPGTANDGCGSVGDDDTGDDDTGDDDTGDDDDDAAGDDDILYEPDEIGGGAYCGSCSAGPGWPAGLGLWSLGVLALLLRRRSS